MTKKQSANRYSELRAASRVRERTLIPPRRVPDELELQARWFAGDFGKNFRSLTGQDIEIVQFGTWNREAGPDFSDAAIRIDDGETIRGNIEFDLTDRYQALESKLRGVQESLELVLDVARDRRMWILEVSIALLILVELVLSVWKH